MSWDLNSSLPEKGTFWRFKDVNRDAMGYIILDTGTIDEMRRKWPQVYCGDYFGAGVTFANDALDNFTGDDLVVIYQDPDNSIDRFWRPFDWGTSSDFDKTSCLCNE